MRVWNKMRRQVGYRPGARAISKRVLDRLDTTTNFIPNYRTMYAYDLTGIASGSTNAINTRQRDVVEYRGFKICMTVRNLGDSPLTLNMAVISPRGTEGSLSDGDTGMTQVLNFFRGNSTEREKNFGDSVGVTDPNIVYFCHSINTDRWHVLSHKRYIIHPRTSGTSHNAEIKNYRSFNRYYKINRQVRFDGTTGLCTTPVYFVFWVDVHMATATLTNTASTLEIQREFTAWFREPRA